MYYIPEEIIELILCKFTDISLQDIANFSFTCWHFYHMIINGERFWRQHFYNRYIFS